MPGSQTSLKWSSNTCNGTTIKNRIFFFFLSFFFASLTWTPIFAIYQWHVRTTKVVFISLPTCVVCNFHSENLSSLLSCSVNTVWDFIYGREINKKWTIWLTYFNRKYVFINRKDLITYLTYNYQNIYCTGNRPLLIFYFPIKKYMYNLIKVVCNLSSSLARLNNKFLLPVSNELLWRNNISMLKRKSIHK